MTILHERLVAAQRCDPHLPTAKKRGDKERRVVN
jgi:hypothetical protein